MKIMRVATVGNLWRVKGLRGPVVVGGMLTRSRLEASSTGVFDAHAHLQLSPRLAKESFGTLGDDDRVALMSVDEDCWPKIAHLRNLNSESVVAAYGIHPWFAHRVDIQSGSWLERLRSHLEEDPTSIVGEIGLDKDWVPPDTRVHAWKDQVEVFTAQLGLAAQMQRPVSVHSVRCPGFMFDTLRGSALLPPTIYLHSYSGSAAMVDSLIKLKNAGPRFYFGFSHYVNEKSKKTLDVLKAVPGDRLLLESDLEDPAQRESDLMKMAEIIARARSWTLEEVLDKTYENAERFYSADDLMGAKV